MRIHRSKQLTRLWHTLPPEVRRFVESLRKNQQPAGCIPIPERPGQFEILLEDYWIIWQKFLDRGETVILVRIQEG